MHWSVRPVQYSDSGVALLQHPLPMEHIYSFTIEKSESKSLRLFVGILIETYMFGNTVGWL